jgi:hypothetical protein
MGTIKGNISPPQALTFGLIPTNWYVCSVVIWVGKNEITSTNFQQETVPSSGKFSLTVPKHIIGAEDAFLVVVVPGGARYNDSFWKVRGKDDFRYVTDFWTDNDERREDVHKIRRSFVMNPGSGSQDPIQVVENAKRFLGLSR